MTAKKRRLWAYAAGVVVCLLLIGGCSGGVDVSGRWLADGKDGEVLLILDDGGKGSWATADDDISFIWEQRGKEIWLHTRAGGVLVGKVREQNEIRFDLPGVGLLVFRPEGHQSSSE